MLKGVGAMGGSAAAGNCGKELMRTEDDVSDEGESGEDEGRRGATEAQMNHLTNWSNGRSATAAAADDVKVIGETGHLTQRRKTNNLRRLHHPCRRPRKDFRRFAAPARPAAAAEEPRRRMNMLRRTKEVWTFNSAGVGERGLPRGARLSRRDTQRSDCGR